MLSRRLFIPVAVVLAAIVALLGYLGYAAVQKRAQQRQVVAVVKDTSAKLRQALSPTVPGSLVDALDANLRAAKAPRDPALAEAAEQYIVGAREVARRRVEIERLEREAAAGRQALLDHMARASSRNNAWFEQAVALKKRVETQHFELGLSLKALDDILLSMPEAEKRLEPHVGAALLVHSTETEKARREIGAELKRSADQLERVRQLR